MTPEATTRTTEQIVDDYVPAGSYVDDDPPEWAEEEKMTFATHRDDEYFESLMAAAPKVDPVAKAAAVEQFITTAESAAEESRAKELRELKFLWSLDNSDFLRFDGSKRSFRWYRPGDTSFFPDPEVIDERNVPAVVVFRGASWNLPTYSYEPKTSYTMDELVAELLPKKYISPAAGDLYHRTVLTDSEDAVTLRDQMDADMLDWLHRDEDEGEIVHRWNSDPEAEMTDEEKAARAEERNEWRTQQTAFLRAKLHKLLKTYFNTQDYRQRDLVTKWDIVGGRYTPAESVNVLEWVKGRVEERGELSGYASLCRSIEYRLNKRRSRNTRNESAWVKAA